LHLGIVKSVYFTEDLYCQTHMKAFCLPLLYDLRLEQNKFKLFKSITASRRRSAVMFLSSYFGSQVYSSGLSRDGI